MSARTLVPDPYADMNRTEKARAQELEQLRNAGLIAAWWYEKWTFKLAKDCRYTPDFVIQDLNGSLRAEETKGFWRDDARVKVRLFASLFPIPIRVLKKSRDGWTEEVFS